MSAMTSRVTLPPMVMLADELPVAEDREFPTYAQAAESFRTAHYLEQKSEFLMLMGWRAESAGQKSEAFKLSKEAAQEAAEKQGYGFNNYARSVLAIAMALSAQTPEQRAEALSFAQGIARHSDFDVLRMRAAFAAVISADNEGDLNEAARIATACRERCNFYDRTNRGDVLAGWVVWASGQPGGRRRVDPTTMRRLIEASNLILNEWWKDHFQRA